MPSPTSIFREDPEVDSARTCIEPKQIAAPRQKEANFSVEADIVKFSFSRCRSLGKRQKNRIFGQGALSFGFPETDKRFGNRSSVGQFTG
jgi:hypothetical protein